MPVDLTGISAEYEYEPRGCPFCRAHKSTGVAFTKTGSGWHALEYCSLCRRILPMPIVGGTAENPVYAHVTEARPDVSREPSVILCAPETVSVVGDIRPGDELIVRRDFPPGVVKTMSRLEYYACILNGTLRVELRPLSWWDWLRLDLEKFRRWVRRRRD